MEQYIDQNRERFLEELKSFLRIPSVSVDSSRKQSIEEAAAFVRDQLLNAGADMAEVCTTSGHPVVYAEKNAGAHLPTVLVYGHYDVQPEDPVELWTTPPFEPTVKGSKIYARGASDDKGQVYMEIKALETLNHLQEFPCNIKYIFEGEEEAGSASLPEFVKNNRERLKADVLLVTDTGMINKETPSITTGLRGLSYLEVEVSGPERDLHSGMYGGAVANPVNVLCSMIGKLKNEQGRITIPGFYNNVEPVSSKEKELMKQIPFDREAFKASLGIPEFSCEEGYSPLECVTIRPSLDVNGIWGGYSGEGAKTVLPARAGAKISMRLVPHQSDEEITKLFSGYFRKLAPESVRVNIQYHHGAEPAVTPMDSPGYKAAEAALEKTWHKKPVPMRMGGSIPIVPMFEKELGIKSVLMGFGLEEDAIHSPNESFDLDNYYQGIGTLVEFFRAFPEKQGTPSA